MPYRGKKSTNQGIFVRRLESLFPESTSIKEDVFERRVTIQNCATFSPLRGETLSKAITLLMAEGCWVNQTHEWQEITFDGVDFVS